MLGTCVDGQDGQVEEHGAGGHGVDDGHDQGCGRGSGSQVIIVS